MPARQPIAVPEPRGKLLIFDTHPIQYRSPVFQALSARHPSTKVFFFNAQFDAKRWWFNEVGKTPKQEWGRVLDEGFACETIGTDRLSLAERWRKLAAILDEEKPAAVAIYGYYLPEHWMLRLSCRARKIPLLFVGETFAPSLVWWRGLLKAPFLRFFFGGISQFVTIGDRNAEFYRRRGIRDSRIVPARYCVDVDFFRLDPARAKEERRRWREANGISECAFVVLMVARLFERKRPHDMLAMERALGLEPEVVFAIAGNGPMAEGLKHASASRPRVKWLGFQDQAATRACYHGADVLLVPSEFETWGLVVNEAFACGIPAIVTDTCGVAGDLVTDGQTGFVYPMGNVAAGRARIERFLKDPALAGKLGAAARERVFSAYRPEHFAQSFLTALERVTDAKSPG